MSGQDDLGDESAPEYQPVVSPAPVVTASMIDETIRLWEPKYRRKLSREEGRQILVNALTFFQTLNALDIQLRRTEAAAKARESCDDEAAA
jgi:hypothetical protein